MDSPKDRLLRIMKEYALSSPSLTKVLGLRSTTSIYRYTNGDMEEFDASFLRRLKAAFPELNPDWLQTGKGEMLRPGQSFIVRQNIRGGHHNRNAQYNFNLSGKEKIIEPDDTVRIEPITPLSETVEAAELRREVEMLRRENAELRGELKAKNELIKMLLPTAKKK